MKEIKKYTALALSVVLSLSLLPIGSAFADSDDGNAEIIQKLEEAPAVTSELIPQIKEDLEQETVSENGVSDDIENVTDITEEMEVSEPPEQTTEPVPETTETPEPTPEEVELMSAVPIDEWWEALKDGDKFDIEVKMLKWPYKEPPSYSMGNGALTGNARLVKEDGKVYAEIDFQPIDMGSTIGHLMDFWYIENQSLAADSSSVETAVEDGEGVVSAFLDKFGTKCEYFYGDDDYIKYVKIPLEDDSDKLIAGLESDFKAMGRQLCVLNFDFTNAIEQITGQKIEKVKKVGTPVISSVLSAEGDSFEISIKIPNTAEASDADIYYMVSGSDDADLSGIVSDENEYGKSFEISKEDAVKLGGTDGTFNVYAIGVKDGYENSVINMKKMTFTAEDEPEQTTEPSESPKVTSTPKPTDKTDNGNNNNSSDKEVDVTKNGKYRVSIALYNASSNQTSMGNVAFKNNSEALITTSGGKSVIRMASNPVSIPPYYSALKDMQFENKSGQWQQVKAIQRATIKASDGSKEYSLNYLQLFEFEIPDTDEDFIPVRINVPYTPMDEIVENDGGYIEARIKINWKRLEKTDSSDELKPNDEDAAGSSKYASAGGSDEEKDKGTAVDITDEKTCIKITADKYVFPTGTKFTFSALSNGKLYDSARTILENDVIDFKLYSVSAKHNKEEIEPTGFAKVYFPVENEDTSKTIIYRITEETSAAKAGKTQVEHELSDDGKYYVISVKALGDFAVGQSDKVVSTPKPQTTSEPKEFYDAAFKDIGGHWASDVINKATEMGLFEGVDNTHFAPELDTTRGMFVTVLGRLKGVDRYEEAKSRYSDVGEADYFCPYTLWAAENGIMSGISEDFFEPELQITREQMAVAICNFAAREGIKLNTGAGVPYSDESEISDWAKESVSAVVNAGIMQSGDSGGFFPKEHMTRAQLAELIMDFIMEYMPEKLSDEE